MITNLFESDRARNSRVDELQQFAEEMQTLARKGQKKMFLANPLLAETPDGPPNSMALNQMAQAQIGQKANPAGTYTHGGGGLMSPLGQSPNIISTILQADYGMTTALPILNQPIPENYGGYDAPYMTLLTGQTSGAIDDIANQPSDVCGNYPQAGLLKACTITHPYGRFGVQVRPFQFTEVGRLVNRGEFTDLAVLNNLAGFTDSVFTGNAPANSDIVNQEWAKRLFEAMQGFGRLLQKKVWTGQVSNNKGTGYREFLGLDTLIGENIYQDAFTRNVCTALNSVVVNFGSTDIGATVGNEYLYGWISQMMYYFEQMADQTGLDNATWALVMPRNLYNALIRLIPIQEYQKLIAQLATINGAASADGVLQLSGDALQNQVYAARAGNYLPIDGKQVPVIFDSGITETAAGSGAFTSTIYIVNLTAQGTPMTYWDFFNFGNGQVRDWLNGQPNGLVKVTADGRFMISTVYDSFCVKQNWVTDPRIMLHTPHLSGKITNIKYTPSLAMRSPFPGDALYYNGGRTNAPLPNVYQIGGSGTTPSFGGLNVQ
jgi:hypothetical protein